MRTMTLICLCLMLQACVSFGGGDAVQVYRLDTSRVQTQGDPVNWQLALEDPVSARILDTDRIVVFTEPFVLKHYKGARWAERAPQLVQDAILEAFERSGRILGVGRSALGLSADYLLLVELRDFQSEYLTPGQPPSAHLRLSLRLLRGPGSQVVAARVIERRELARSEALPDVIAAFDAALAQMLAEAVDWSLDAGNADRAAGDVAP